MNLRSGKIAFTKAKKQNKTKNQKEVAWLEIQKDVGDKKKKKKKKFQSGKLIRKIVHNEQRE